MRFDSSQRFEAPLDDVAAAFASEDLYFGFVDLPKLGVPDVLGRTEDGDRVRLRLRYRFVGDLSPAVTAVIDPKKLTWVEESEHHLAAGVVRVRLVPDHYPDRLSCSGRYRYESDGDATVRHIQGDLKVRALLVAGAVEKAIVSGLAEHLDAEVPVVEAYLG